MNAKTLPRFASEHRVNRLQMVERLLPRHQGRKALLLRLDEGLNLLRVWRKGRRQVGPAEQTRYSEVKLLLQTVQNTLVRILVLNRENQQALLRRGLVPARHVPSFAFQPPHYAARRYRRHAS